MELQAPPLHIHPPGSFRLHSNNNVPPRVSVDCKRVRRSNHPHMELAKPGLHLRPHGPQSLRHVRFVPPNRGFTRICLFGSNRQGLGYFR